MLIDNLIPWSTLNFHSGIAFSDKGLYVAIVFKTSTKHFDFFLITACFVLESQKNMWDIVMLAPAPHMGNSLSEPFPQRIANNKLKVGIVLFTDGLCVKATCRDCFFFSCQICADNRNSLHEPCLEMRAGSCSLILGKGSIEKNRFF